MSILRIYADSRGPGRCRSCGAAIEWAELESGKRMPFDPPVVPVRMQGNLVQGQRIIEDVDTTVTSPHWATCPDAEKWRRR